MESISSESLFSDDELDMELVQNQPLRISGLASLAFGLLSVIAFTASYMWAVPALAVLLGFIALRPSKGLYVGKTAASIGICFGLFFGSWAVFRHYGLSNHRIDTVTDFAVDWLDSFKASEPEFSFEMTLPYSDRHYKTIDLQEFYIAQIEKDRAVSEEEMEEKITFERFTNLPLVKALLAAGDKPKWRLREILSEHKQYTLRFYEMVFEDTTSTVSPVTLKMQRYQARDGSPVYWHVQRYEYWSGQ